MIIKPIGLQHENTDSQAHDIFSGRDILPVSVVELAELLSKKTNNTVKLGSDGKLFVPDCCNSVSDIDGSWFTDEKFKLESGITLNNASHGYMKYITYGGDHRVDTSYIGGSASHAQFTKIVSVVRNIDNEHGWTYTRYPIGYYEPNFSELNSPSQSKFGEFTKDDQQLIEYFEFHNNPKYSSWIRESILPYAERYIGKYDADSFETPPVNSIWKAMKLVQKYITDKVRADHPYAEVVYFDGYSDSDGDLHSFSVWANIDGSWVEYPASVDVDSDDTYVPEEGYIAYRDAPNTYFKTSEYLGAIPNPDNPQQTLYRWRETKYPVSINPTW